MSVVHIFSSSRQELRGKQARVWTKAVQDVGLDLDPYDCKASYVCGMLRQFIGAAGMQLGHDYHLGALVEAACAVELLGSCYKGEDSGDRIGEGVRYLEAVGPPYDGSVHHPESSLAGWVRDIRNFGAHGTVHRKHVTLDRVLTVWLLRSLARALDAFWASGGDRHRHQCFARVPITPLYTEGEPLFVREVQDHLAQGLMPGEKLDYEVSWRPLQSWEDQPTADAFRVVFLNASPAVTGTG